MDITIDVDDYKLNVRAAGVMIHNGKFWFIEMLILTIMP